MGKASLGAVREWEILVMTRRIRRLEPLAPRRFTGGQRRAVSDPTHPERYGVPEICARELETAHDVARDGSSVQPPTRLESGSLCSPIDGESVSFWVALTETASSAVPAAD